jgi:hypothetical protein
MGVLWPRAVSTQSVERVSQRPFPERKSRGRAIPLSETASPCLRCILEGEPAPFGTNWGVGECGDAARRRGLFSESRCARWIGLKEHKRLRAGEFNLHEMRRLRFLSREREQAAPGSRSGPVRGTDPERETAARSGFSTGKSELPADANETLGVRSARKAARVRRREPGSCDTEHGEPCARV